MARICTVMGCGFKVFGTDRKTKKGYCNRHQYKRTDLKPSKVIRGSLTKKYKPTGEKDLFMEIWAERAHKSFISGIDLDVFKDTIAFMNCFAHVIPKNGTIQLVFPDTETKDRMLRLNKRNIVLLSPIEHLYYDMGTDNLRNSYMRGKADWKKLYDKKDKLIISLKKLL